MVSQLSWAHNDTPVKVFTHEEHYGKGANSLHNRMNTWERGTLSKEGIKGYTDKTKLIDDLIEFYSDKNPDLAKAVRGWASQHGIPYTK